MPAINQTASAVKPLTGATFKNGTAGGTITAGMPLYLDAADGKLKAARANAQDTAEVVGIAMNSASNGQPLTYQTSGQINLGASLVNSGLVYFLSPDEAGKIVPSSDVQAADEWTSIIAVSDTDQTAVLVLFNSGVAPA